jgi:DNA-binding Lrp family transcriptional regulator
MRATTILRRKGVKEAVQHFVERVSQLPQVEAVLLVWGDEGLEVRVIVPEPDLSVVDAIAEAEGEMIDQLSELPFISDVIFRQGKPLDEFVSPQTHFLFRR